MNATHITSQNFFTTPIFVKSMTATTFCVATAASAIIATSVATGGVAFVVFAILAGIFAAGSISSVSAWIFDDSNSIRSYFSTFASHLILTAWTLGCATVLASVVVLAQCDIGDSCITLLEPGSVA